MDEKITILLVDNEDAGRQQLVEMLGCREYAILQAESGQKALDIVHSDVRVDVIMMALDMPEMSGLEVLERLKGDEKYSYIPVIVSAQRGDYEKECRALELGADNLILKPYDPRMIIKWIAHLIERYVKQNRRMKKQVKEATYKLESLVDTVPGGIAIMDYDGRISLEFFNDGFCEITEYTREELESYDSIKVEQLVDEQDCETFRQMFQSLEVDGIPVNFAMRILCKSRRKKWVTISAKKLYSGAEDFVFHVVLLDISGKYETERLLMNSKMELRYRAERDSLTGIYNRDKFYIKTREMIETAPEEKYVLVLWNIDHFRIVNEMFGSSTGDKMLCFIARKLESLVQGNGTYARLEADHFATCTTVAFIEQHMDIVEQMLAGEGLDNDWNYPLMMHAGFYYVKDNHMQVSSMCDRAGIAVKHIKANYLKRWYVYNSELKEIMVTEQELVNDMTKALEQRQFFVMYQPIIDAKTQQMISAEALVRWKHPTKGLISPGVFIPLFEKNGFITKLDHYVCEEVCVYLSERQKQGKKIVPVSVNLSRVNFYNHNLCNDIIELTKKYELDPYYLKLEVTESAYTDNPMELINMINLFQKNGFKILMDDFGSGYSSLNMLKDVSVDILKIDMKFMEELEISNRANNILFSIIQMAKALNMNIVGEGVETQNQYELLANMGCDSIQGYYFSKPVVSDEFAQMLEKREVDEDSVPRESKPVILVVDDVKMNRQIVKDAIGKEYAVVEAEDGEEALRILKHESSHISLVITDLCMPNMSGLELLEVINHLSHLKKIPVLVVTSYGDENISKALQLGALDVIGRPYNEEILRLRVKNILKLSRNATIEKEIFFLRQAMNR